MADESGGVRRDGLGAGRAEIYTYEAPWMIYACNWSVRATKRLASGATIGRRRMAEKGRGGGRGRERDRRRWRRARGVVGEWRGW